MKNIFLFCGVALVVLNTVFGVILVDYSISKMFFGNLSIVLSTGLLHFLYKSQTADGFKIGLSVLFGISGLIRFICAVSSTEEIRNNYSLLIFFTIFIIESIVLFLGYTLSKK